MKKYRIIKEEQEGRHYTRYIPQYQVSILWGRVKWWTCWCDGDSDVSFTTKEGAEHWISVKGKPPVKISVIEFKEK